MASTENNIRLFCDGGSRGNPGPAAAGIYLEYPAGNLRLLRGKYLGVNTNNFAEYQGVILGLSVAKEIGRSKTPLEVFLDSALVVNQLNGKFRLKAAHLAELLLQVKALEKDFPTLSYQQIPREKNSLADSAVNRSLNSKGDFNQSL